MVKIYRNGRRGNIQWRLHTHPSFLSTGQVDKHIRRLDSDLSRFEQELQVKDQSVRQVSISSVTDLQVPVSISKMTKIYSNIPYILGFKCDDKRL